MATDTNPTTFDDPNDPAAQLRKRIAGQVSASTTGPINGYGVSNTGTPTTPATYAGPNDVSPVKPFNPVVNTGTPTTPATYDGPGDTSPVKPFGAPGIVVSSDPRTSNTVGITDPPFVDPSTTPAAPASPVAPSPAAPAAPQVGAGPIPTNPDGSQVGGGTPWDPKTGAPTSAPPGYHWDPTLAMFQPGDAPGGSTAPTTRPTGGNLSDPAYRAKFIAWAATQPGVNPSVINDPGYWDQAFASGRFGNDQNYALQRMMQAEGAPEGGGSGPSSPAMPPAVSPFSAQVRAMLLDRMGKDSAPVNDTDSNIAEPFAAANLTAQRGQQAERTALAERLAANGDTSGSLERGIQQSAERNAVGLGTFKGQLIQKEYAARRADLADAMNQALQSGDRETAYTLQMALAQLDAQLRREGYGVNLAEFGANQNTAASNAGTGA
jgi:hypothetical protein